MTTRSPEHPGIGSRLYSRIMQSYKLRLLFKTVVGVETGERVTALTFDDGPDPRWSPVVLDILARYDAKGTFFLLGHKVAAHPDLARRIVEEGHAIGNHTFSHPCLAECRLRDVVRELAECRRAIVAATGIAPRLMRPPYGAQRIDTFVTTRGLGYEVVHWSAAGQDWLGDPGRVVAERVLSELTPGGIVLLHDSWEPPPGAHSSEHDAGLADRTATIEALELIVEASRRQGYRFVTVPELLAVGPRRRRSWFWD